jgi:DNA (cytosine-5)-methyltransferase 1
MAVDRLVLLDTFCKAGGAGMGYHRAGFDVVGVDIEPQPHYPFRFIQADAIEYIREHGHEYDAIHASPPCQGYSRTRSIPGRDASSYPLLIEDVRSLLIATGQPWVIENVPGAPLVSGVMLCGAMFGLRVYRHRLFESSVFLLAPPHMKHREKIGTHKLASYIGQPGAMVTVAGHLFSREAGSVAMGIDWMTREELAEAIPPAYTEFIGTHLLAAVSACPSAVTTLLGG